MTLITFANQLVELDAQKVLEFLPGLAWEARADKPGKKHNPRYYASLLARCHAGPFEAVRESFNARGPKTEEHRAKISAALTGKKWGPPSEETRAKIAAAKTGKKRGPPGR
ncbi:hypothetical protein HYH03_011944 [Edaphochlamys debaryana]|uniref:Nuclease associated modular domain-containing protein n=1 Tax=Edaphochlamys debaryana TaxID=47281 RepID=A0A836BUE9_9CHLO|nr:hypothetical protein HYH03_011944 [Edaphochlamys debaryana]|eukprot:KAG2489491.1 hypothetical protein HYH03_011944 [Edaphochlamys debaryana]